MSCSASKTRPIKYLIVLVALAKWCISSSYYSLKLVDCLIYKIYIKSLDYENLYKMITKILKKGYGFTFLAFIIEPWRVEFFWTNSLNKLMTRLF